MEVEGHSKDDAEKVHKDLNTVFADKKFDALRALFTRGKKNNKKAFDKIGGDALKGALSGLEGDDLALAQLVTGAINSDDVHVVEFAESGDKLSSDAKEGMDGALSKLYTDNGIPVPTMPESRKASEVKAAGGSGQNFPTDKGSHSVVLEGSDITHTGGRRELTTMHEVFGHGIPSAAKTIDKVNNTHAIRTENLVRRVLGIKAQRDGSGHSGGKISNPKQVPSINKTN